MGAPTAGGLKLGVYGAGGTVHFAIGSAPVVYLFIGFAPDLTPLFGLVKVSILLSVIVI